MIGYKELLAIDFDENAVETFKLNFKDVPVWKADVMKLTGVEIMDFCGIEKGDLDVLDGSPPCQGFSTAGKQCVTDDRNDLVNHYIRLVREIRPRVFVMENVSGMVKGNMKGLFIGYVHAMKGAGYRVECRLLNAKWFSVPQSRERLICIGVRDDLRVGPAFPKAHDRIMTVGDAIRDLEALDMDASTDHVWIPVKTSHKVYKKLIRCKAGDKLNFGFARRLNYSRPAGTLQTSGVAGPYVNSSWFAHPTLNRPISIREAARLQSFPDTFRFIGTLREMAYRIGNSVPPLMAEAIAETVSDGILAKAWQP